MRMREARPMSALLSQTLVAFTVELDNAFELRMSHEGIVGARLSLLVWLGVMRFVPTRGIALRDLAALAEMPRETLVWTLGGLERWGFVAVGDRKKREGFGSGRGLNGASLISPTPHGELAQKIWMPLVDEISERWKTRFGSAFSTMKKSLTAIARAAGNESSFPELLAHALSTFAADYAMHSRVPLAIAANAIRVLDEKRPTRVADLARLTGASPERSDFGLQLARLVEVERDLSGKGKVARLTELGGKAQRNYHRAVALIESDWEIRFGKKCVQDLRKSIESLFLRISEALTPPEGVTRSGFVPPALGRRELGPAAKKRARDLVAQTKSFMEDPAGSLPHYPLWDMNRGFGP